MESSLNAEKASDCPQIFAYSAETYRDSSMIIAQFDYTRKLEKTLPIDYAALCASASAG
jgi:hypothetical protein